MTCNDLPERLQAAKHNTIDAADKLPRRSSQRTYERREGGPRSVCEEKPTRANVIEE
jgi:hypothetical protein